MADEKKTEAPEIPVARIVSEKPREKLVPIDFPVEFDGIVYEAIKVRRISGKELQTYFDGLGVAGVFNIPPVVDCPMEVWDAMDADDQEKVDEIALAFMPRRLKAAAQLLEAPGEASSAS